MRNKKKIIIEKKSSLFNEINTINDRLSPKNQFSGFADIFGT